MDNLCLYGHANGSWTVGLPTEEVPTELPEPTLGINYARDGMKASVGAKLVPIIEGNWISECLPNRNPVEFLLF